MHKSPSSPSLTLLGSPRISLSTLSKWVPRGNGLAVALIQKICATLIVLDFNVNNIINKILDLHFELNFLHQKTIHFQYRSIFKTYMLRLLARWRFISFQKFPSCISVYLLHRFYSSLNCNVTLYFRISNKPSIPRIFIQDICSLLLSWIETVQKGW